MLAQVWFNARFVSMSFKLKAKELIVAPRSKLLSVCVVTGSQQLLRNNLGLSGRSKDSEALGNSRDLHLHANELVYKLHRQQMRCF